MKTRTPKFQDARSLATHILIQVIIHRHSLSDSLNNNNLPDPRDRALVHDICYGVLRYLPRLQILVSLLLTKPLRKQDQDIQIVLMIGLYQHLYLRVPSHAATATTVKLVDYLKKTWAKGLVNAVLREFQRRPTELLNQLDTNLSARLAHPMWLLTQLQTDWPQHWEAIAQANNQHPNFTLRVNPRLISREQYLQHLQDQRLIANPVPHTDQGIVLEQAVEVQDLPGFTQGWVSVQDAGAQLAASLLDVPSGTRVLDACAAPGGKTAHLLERYNPREMVAIDLQPERVKKLHNTLKRLQLSATLICADASQPTTWWDGQLFARILLDVPCSASGVIRRHPDIKYLRQPQDLPQFVQQQTRLLDALWPLLSPGGKLLYSTCSLFSAENHHVIEHFLATHPDTQLVDIPGQWGHALPIGRQTLPSDSYFDGFYYACLYKTNN